jgi:isoleucyl-tRNA synthetase
MRRVEEVFDCWFESGSMPYAQVHYPFENREWFDAHYPGDFITEYIGQTRGWFYTLHVLATALFDRPAFRACLAHGIVLGEDGQKMSKSLRNYPDVYEMFDKYGSDAMRWFLLSSAILRGADMSVTERGIEEQVRQVILPIWNAYYFFTLYANTDGRTATFRTDAGGPLDRYILAKTHQLVEQVTAAMDAYDLFGACASIRTFLDALTNWYIRRSRDRFWDGDGDAYDTLYTVLVLVCRTVAPLLPLIGEAVYTGLTGDRSVHLTVWPDADELPRDDDLVAAMDLVRDVCSAASSVRKARGLRVRLPLARLTVAAPGATALDSFRDLIEDEVNVKEVVLTDEVGAAGELVLKVAPAVLGPRIGPAVQQVIKAVRAGDWRQVDGQVVVGDRTLEPDEYTLQLVPADETTGRPLPGNNGLVVLDVDVTPELEAEGLARDVVRLIQQARKDAGLHVSDRIHLVLDCGHHDDIRQAVERHRQWLMDQTLALELVLDQPLRHGHRGELSDGRAVHIGITKAPEA